MKEDLQHRIEMQRQFVRVLKEVVNYARLAFEDAALACLEINSTNKKENREVRQLRQTRDKAEKKYIGLNRTYLNEKTYLEELEKQFEKENKGKE